MHVCICSYVLLCSDVHTHIRCVVWSLCHCMLYSICIYIELIVFNEQFYTKQKYLVLSETIYYMSVGLLSDLMSIACYI